MLVLDGSVLTKDVGVVDSEHPVAGVAVLISALMESKGESALGIHPPSLSLVSLEGHFEEQ